MEKNISRKEYVQSYEEKYGVFKDYNREVLFLQKIFQLHGCDYGSSVLDLACGTGTHIVQLAQMGYVCEGLDFNPDMLDKVRDKSKKTGLSIALHQDDMRHFRLDRNFSAVINMFYSFQDALQTEEDQGQCLNAIHSALKPGGILVMEFLPEENNLRRYPIGGTFLIHQKKEKNGVLYEVSSCNRLLENNLKEITFTFTWSQEGKIIRQQHTKSILKRMYLKTINSLFETHGFTLLSRHGGYSFEDTFGPESEKMIAVFIVK